MFGILLIDKPKGITSHGVISRLRKILNIRRIGHAGTLDPLATGLLVIAVGPATRFLQYLDLEPKTYVATVTFGESTNTFDAEGTVTQSRVIPENLEEKINETIPSFRGQISQTPPVFSAIKVKGKPLYDYARQGEEVEVKPRTQTIHTYRLDSIQNDEAVFTITCDGGTYIRSLAHDLGEAIGCGAHIKELRRTGAGKFHSEQAIPLELVTPSDILPPNFALAHLPQIILNPVQLDHIRHGRPAQTKTAVPGPIAALLTESGNVIGIANVLKKTELHPTCTIPTELFDQLIKSQ